MLQGWAFRYKMLPDGRRQLLNFALPGDFLGLQASLFKEMSHSVEALSQMLLCVFPASGCGSCSRTIPASPSTSPGSARARSRSSTRTSFRSAAARRSSAPPTCSSTSTPAPARSGWRRPDSFFPPLTQQHLADALGLSIVHTNKTLKRLSDRKIIRWKNRELEILDIEGASRDRLVGGRRRRNTSAR